VALQHTISATATRNLLATDRKPHRAVLDAAKAASTVVLLALLAQQLDHWPSQKEYAQAYEMSERKAQMQWELFREAFPGEESPVRMAEWLNNHARPKDQSAVFTAPTPPFLAATAA